MFQDLLGERREQADSFSYATINPDEILERTLTAELRMEDELSFQDRDSEFKLLVHAYLRDTHYQTRTQAIYNLIYIIVNACFAALPYACYEVGIPLFVCGILVFGGISGYTSCMIIALAGEQNYPRPRSLEDLTELAYGTKGYLIVAILQISLSMTLMCMSLGLFSEIMSSSASTYLPATLPIFESSPWLYFLLTSRKGMVLVGGALTLPVVLTSASLANLKWVTYMTILCFGSAFAAVVVAFIGHFDYIQEGDAIASRALTPKVQWWTLGFIGALCFSSNQKTFTVYSSLRQRNSDRWNYVVRHAYVIVIAMYVCFGCLGYLSHMSKLCRFNYFLDIDGGGDLPYDILRSIVAICVLFLLPSDGLVASTTLRRVLRHARAAYTAGGVESTWTEGENDPLAGVVCDPSTNSRTNGMDLSTVEEADTPMSTPSQSPSRRASSQVDGGRDRSSGDEGQGEGGGGVGRVSPTNAGQRGTVESDDTDWVSYSDKSSVRTSGPSGRGSGSTSGHGRSSSSSPSSQGAYGNDERRSEAGCEGSCPSDHSISVRGRVIEEDSGEDDEALRKARKERSSSIGDVQHALAQRKAQAEGVCGSCFASCDSKHVAAMLTVWAIATSVSFLSEAGVALAATVGGISTAALTFIVPALLYARLGLASDYQTRPLMKSFPALGVPNQVYMGTVGVLGVLLLLGNIAVVAYTLAHGSLDMGSETQYEDLVQSPAPA